MLKLRCQIKAKKLASESAYLDVITVRIYSMDSFHTSC